MQASSRHGFFRDCPAGAIPAGGAWCQRGSRGGGATAVASAGLVPDLSQQRLELSYEVLAAVVPALGDQHEQGANIPDRQGRIGEEQVRRIETVLESALRHRDLMARSSSARATGMLPAPSIPTAVACATTSDSTPQLAASRSTTTPLRDSSRAMASRF